MTRSIAQKDAEFAFRNSPQIVSITPGDRCGARPADGIKLHEFRWTFRQQRLLYALGEIHFSPQLHHLNRIDLKVITLDGNAALGSQELDGFFIFASENPPDLINGLDNTQRSAFEVDHR